MKNLDRILILDPFKNLLNIYQTFLELENYRVETASHLKEATQKLSEENYAVLITEFLPPYEESLHLIHRIKEQSPETYILIVTNATLDETMYEKLLSIGVDDLILKPYSLVKISAHIKKGFENRDLFVQKQKLERESLTDPITSKIKKPIFNLLHFKRCLQQELKRSKRHRHSLSLLLVEIPDKERTGIPFEGFQVELIKLLRNNTREEDIVGRGNGGFGILLPETDEVGSQALVKRLLQLTQTHPSFKKDHHLKSIIKAVSFEAFTYPENFFIPEPLRSVLEQIP